jgi:uncharacterized membrane protein
MADESPLSSSLRHNIEALGRWREEEDSRATLHKRAAGVITRFSGSMYFVYLHVAI